MKAENILEFNKILSYHQSHRAGFGALSIPEVPPKHSHDYHKLLSLWGIERIFGVKSSEGSSTKTAVCIKWCSYVKQGL